MFSERIPGVFRISWQGMIPSGHENLIMTSYQNTHLVLMKCVAS